MKATVLSNVKRGNRYGIMNLLSPDFVKKYQSGQFFMIAPSSYDKSYDPLLKRPFAPYSINEKDGTFSFLYAVVGRGTTMLCNVHDGEELSLSIALGKGFSIPKGKNIALVAGGVGIGPMNVLYDAAIKKDCKVSLFYGARSVDDLFIDETKYKDDVNLFVTTEDGSKGRKGFITSNLEEMIGQYDYVYSCGPLGMLKAVQQICSKHDKPIEVSLEEHMACGIGVCTGCMVGIKDGGSVTNKRCCTEGPVFDGHKVDWSSLERK